MEENLEVRENLAQTDDSQQINIRSENNEQDNHPTEFRTSSLGITQNIEKSQQFTDENKKKNSFKISWAPLSRFIFCCFIGHVGISDCSGRVYDFKNSYIVGADFGDKELRYFSKPAKDYFCFLDSEQDAESLYSALQIKSKIYKSRSSLTGLYKFLSNNCHHFVADVLNTIKYKGKDDYTAWWVWRRTFFHGHYRNWESFLRTWVSPLIIITLMIIALIIYFSTKLMGYNI